MKKIKPIRYGEDIIKDEPYYPSLHLDSKQLSEIKNWEVGKSYTITLKIKQTSKIENDKGDIMADFNIIGIENNKKRYA